MRTLWLVWTMAVFPAVAAAQDVEGLPVWDVGASVGWFASDRDVSAARFIDDSNNRWVLGGAAGYYWTEHLRTAVRFAATTAGRGYVSIPIEQSAERPAYAFGEYHARDALVSIEQFYQFGRNAWVHPYLGAGIALSRETLTTIFDRRAYPQVQLPDDPPDETAWKVRPVLSGGLKTYLTPRTFFRAHVSVSPSSDTRNVALTFGFGTDFGSRRVRRTGDDQGRTRRMPAGADDSTGDGR